MKISMAKLLSLQGALSNLDFYEKIVGDKVVKELYTLGGAMRFRIARNMNKIEPEITAFHKARNALVTQYSNGDGKVDMTAFALAERDLLDSQIELDLILFKEDDLALDTNPIPGTVLWGLMPIIGD